jgi:hypothetical protein
MKSLGYDNYLAQQVEDHFAPVACDCCGMAEAEIDVKEFNGIESEHWYSENLSRGFDEKIRYICYDCRNEYENSIEHLRDRFVSFGFYPENY